MFYRNNYRPAVATAGAASESKFRSETSHGLMFNSANSETDDFGAFNTAPETSRPPKKPSQKKKPSNKKGFALELNLKTILIAAASLVALILLIVVIVAVANSSGSNITAENNTYIAYEAGGQYYLAQNGDIIGAPFSTEIRLTPAKDNSFAYVEEDTDDGINIYILEDKKLMQVVPHSVTEVVALAELKPGIVYIDGGSDGKVKFYADENEESLGKVGLVDNCVISPDASAVTYTKATVNNPTEPKLFLYVDGIEESYGSNLTPVKVTNGGKYIYAYESTLDEGNKLYAINVADAEKKDIVSKFHAITYMNVKGEEIVYAINDGTNGYRSYIYNAKKDESFKIGAGICQPLVSDESVIALASLKDVFMENIYVTNNGTSATYYIKGSDYKSTPISSFNGKLNKDEDKFYYIAKSTSDNGVKSEYGTLYFIDLDDKNRTPQRLVSDVVDFVVTAKDNVYFLTDLNSSTGLTTLKFCKTSTKKSRTVADDVESYSMNQYSNILYYKVNEDVKIYMTEEGPGSEIATFDRNDVQNTPIFLDQGQKRSFVCINNDPATELYDIYYTSSGKTYKLLAADCTISEFSGFDDDIYIPDAPTAPTTPEEDPNSPPLENAG